MTRPDADEPIDISIPFAARLPVWPGDTPFSCGWTGRRENGSSVNLGAITTSPHAGTHADAPLHVESSWAASEHLPVAAFVGPALVLTVPATRDGSTIALAEVQSLLGQRRPVRLLLRTGASVREGQFPTAWPALSEDAATWLAANGVRLVGTDAPSVDARDSTALPVHRALFARGAFLLENLDLRQVADGAYELLAQPLAVEGIDAAPVRALLRRVPAADAHA